MLWNCRPSGAARQDTNVGQIAIALRIVQPVSDHELIRNRKAHVFGLNWRLPSRWFIEQDRHAKALRFMRQQVPLQKRESQAGVENIFDQNYIGPAQRLFHILGYAHFSRGIPGAPAWLDIWLL